MWFRILRLFVPQPRSVQLHTDVNIEGGLVVGKKIKFTSQDIPTPLHMWLNSHPAVARALPSPSPAGREASPSSSRLFKQSPAPRLPPLTAPCAHLRRQRRSKLTDKFWSLYFTCERSSGRTCALVLCGAVCALLHSALQPFDLLVVVGPLGHDPHGGLQLGLLRHRVVTLRKGVGWKKCKRQRRLCCCHAGGMFLPGLSSWRFSWSGHRTRSHTRATPEAET